MGHLYYCCYTIVSGIVSENYYNELEIPTNNITQMTFVEKSLSKKNPSCIMGFHITSFKAMIRPIIDMLGIQQLRV